MVCVYVCMCQGHMSGDQMTALWSWSPLSFSLAFQGSNSDQAVWQMRYLMSHLTGPSGVSGFWTASQKGGLGKNK